MFLYIFTKLLIAKKIIYDNMHSRGNILNIMAKFHILKWLYRHSPVNFYSITENSEIIIKSINNTFVGYKYNKIPEQNQIEKLRNDIKHFKRLFTVTVLIAYVLLIYGIIFPNYDFFIKNYINAGLIIFIAICLIIVLAFCNSKIFEKYLKRNFGEFEKTHFPSSNSIESQSYKDFKLELVKIFVLILIICGAYIWIGSPYETSVELINKGKYNDAIKMTTIWSKIIPREARWYSLRGYAKYCIADFEGAIADYDKAYLLEDDEFKTMNFDNKIFIKYSMKDFSSALKDFDTEIEKTDDEYNKDQLLWDKAQFLYNINQYKQALEIYNQLIINAENDSVYLLKSRLYYERAQVYQALDKSKEAQQDIDTAQELNLSETFQNPIPKPTLLLDDI